MAVDKDIRRVRVDGDTWMEYARIVGDLGRARDIRAYIEWRIDNPRTPLPGKRRGPLVRNKPSTEAASDATESTSA